MATLQTSPASPIRKPNPQALERYTRAAFLAGCPRDQLENFMRAGIVLQPKQLQASAAARECDHEGGPTKLGYGGARGGGKSHWMLAQMGGDDCQRAPGLKCLLLRKVGKANKENFEDLRRRLFGGIKHSYNRSEGILTFENESRIIAGHYQNESDVDSYLGLEYDVIGIEEATTLTTRKRRDIGTCNRTSRGDGWRPRIYETTNPGGVGHAAFKAEYVEPFRKEQETDTRFIPATVYDNAAVNSEYRKKLEQLTGWQRRAWLLGDWDIAAGQFFTTFRRDVHVIKPFHIPITWRVWVAMDYGFTHFTACHLFAEDGDGNVYVIDEHGERGWLPQRHAPAIIAMLQRNNRSVDDISRFVAGADVFAKKAPTGTVATIADAYRALGIQLWPANDDRINGAGEILTRLGDVDAEPVIAPRLYIFDRCARLIEQLPALEHDPHRPEDVLKVDCDEDGNGGDDFYDCFRYGTMERYTGNYAGAGDILTA